MKKTRKFGPLALAIALPLSLTLAACGGNGGDTDKADGGSGSDGNTLTVWTWDPNFNIAAMQEAEKIYQQDHPDFSLNIVETPWDDLQTKLTTLAQSQQTKELPDIFLIQNNACQKNVINYPDLFADYGNSSVDFSQFPASTTAYCEVDGKN